MSTIDLFMRLAEDTFVKDSGHYFEVVLSLTGEEFLFTDEDEAVQRALSFADAGFGTSAIFEVINGERKYLAYVHVKDDPRGGYQPSKNYGTSDQRIPGASDNQYQGSWVY